MINHGFVLNKLNNTFFLLLFSFCSEICANFF